MEKGRYNIENIYQGGYSSLNPEKGYGSAFTGYHSTAGSLGLTTDPRSANIIKEVSSKLSTGVKKIELALVQPQVFDSMPKTQLKEIQQLSKLTGIDVSVHGPVIDSAGMTQQGFSELNREDAQRRITEIIERSHEMDSKGNIPVVLHSSEGIPGAEWETLSGERKMKRMIAVDRESGKMIPLEIKEKYSLGEEKVEGKTWSPEKQLESANQTEWDNSIGQILFQKERADEILQKNFPQIESALKFFQEQKITNNEELNKILEEFPEQRKAWNHYKNAETYLQDIHTHLNALFSKSFKYGTENQQRELKKLNEQFRNEIEKNPSITGQSQAMQTLMIGLKSPVLVPKMFTPIENFAVEQSSKTFGNAAFDAYKKFGGDSPVLAIENPPVGHALSTGEDLKNLVKESREKFVERAVKEKGMGRREAEKVAEKLIGATWDVGHINMLRKQGFKEEDIIKETEKIAPFVKHVHLSDNFGFEHTELPMGMGNVPIKKIMEKLGEKGFEARKIIEAGNWWQHFQTPPVVETLEGLGSPMYSVGGMPYWNQRAGLSQGYLSGFEGAWLPQINYETFGAGFSHLPSELGGQRPGAQGNRMSGRPME